MFASGCTNAAFNWGVTTGDVVRVVLLFYLMPLWTLLLARLLLREPLHAGVLARAALALGGALVMLWPAEGGWPVPSQPADWLGLIGGVSFALNNVMLRREAHRHADARALAMFSGGALIGGAAALLGAGAGVAIAAVAQRARLGPAAGAAVAVVHGVATWRCSTAPRGCAPAPPRW